VRLVYLGTPDVAVPPLEALVDAGHDVELVVTGPDRRRGRGAATSPSAVKSAAQARGIAVTHTLAHAAEHGAELGVVVAYGRIIPSSVLDVLPMVNLHFSLLPRWRGAAPVERAILAGDARTGVCVMDVAEGLDEGGVYDRVEVPIGSDVSADELREALVSIGSRLLVERLGEGLGTPVPQAGEPTYAHKLSIEDRRLDWTRTADELHRIVRVGDAHTAFRGERFKIHAAAVMRDGSAGAAPGTLHGAAIAAGDGALVPSEVQPAGGTRMSWASFANGARPLDGERFGDTVDVDG
jgi:methionyl-tRNA formyltransferase